MMVPDGENDDRHRDFSRRCHLYSRKGRGVQSGGTGKGG